MIYCRNVIREVAGRAAATNGGRNMNASHSEDSVAETTLSKKNSDGERARVSKESSVSLLFTDEDEDQPRYVQLTNQHKTAIRAIRKVSVCVSVSLSSQRVY